MPDDDRERMALYKQGLNDYEIARRQGVGKSTISKWRWRQGLPPNGRRGRHGRNAGNVTMDEALTPEEQAVARFGLRIITAAVRNGVDISEAFKAARNYISRDGTSEIDLDEAV